MKIAITGATGFIGRALARRLAAEGHSLHAMGRTRPEGMSFSPWDAAAEAPPAEALDGAGAVIHLAGEPVAQRWTEEARRKIRATRIESTRRLVEALAMTQRRPGALVCASAIGIYGTRGDEELTEASPPGRGFLPEVCTEWERAAEAAEALGVRVVRVRIGLVLGRGGGALARMLGPFKMGAGGRLGSGRQWMSWIHLDDLAELIRFAAVEGALRGPVNGTAPNPVTNAEFTRTLAAALHRPAVFPVPAFALKLLFGEMAEVLIESQRVLPKAAEAAGFRFGYPELGGALRQILAE